MTPLAAGLSVRRLSPNDLEGALALSTAAGWNQRADDWHMLLALAPEGSIAAAHDGRVVGTAIGIDYGPFSWIAMMLVDPEFRGRGIGRRLLEAALDAVPAGTPVRLDATPMGRPLYQRYGFEDECSITRCTADAPTGGAQQIRRARTAHIVRPMTRADLATLAAFDREAFGGERPSLLAWSLEVAPEFAHVIDPRGGDAPLQYCLGRRGRLFDQIGPVVAASAETARALAAAALAQAAGRPVVMDVFDAHGEFAGWIHEQGLQPQRPLFRMQRAPRHGSVGTDSGTNPALGHPGAGRRVPSGVTGLLEFAIFGPEFA